MNVILPIACAAAMLLPRAKLGAQPVRRAEVAAVIGIVKTGANEGSLAIGGRVSRSVTSAVGLEAQVTLGTTLGDGNDGDVIATAGVRAHKAAGRFALFVALRPGILRCGEGPCAAVNDVGTFFTTYIGAGIERATGRRVFYRIDAGNTLVNLRGAERPSTRRPENWTHNTTIGFSLGVRL